MAYCVGIRASGQGSQSLRFKCCGAAGASSSFASNVDYLDSGSLCFPRNTPNEERGAALGVLPEPGTRQAGT